MSQLGGPYPLEFVVRLYNSLRGMPLLGLASAMVASAVLLSPTMGCGASEPPADHDVRDAVQSGNAEPESPGYVVVEVIPSELDFVEAVARGHVDTVRRYLREGADPNRGDAYGSPPPLWLALSSRSPEMVRILIDAGADPNISVDGTSLVQLAAQINDPEIMALILGAGEGVAHDRDGEVEAMFIALRQGHFDALKAMLDAGADPNAQVPATGYVDLNADGERDLWMVPVLYEAVKRERFDAVKLLLDAGADPDATGYVYIIEGEPVSEENIAAALGIAEDPDVEGGPFGSPPIHAAVFEQNVEIVEALLNAGADTESVNQFGETALIEAVKWENIAIVTLLIEAGANLDVENRFGHTPLEILEGRENKELEGVLRQAGQ